MERMCGAVGREEHVLRPAKSDTLGPEFRAGIASHGVSALARIAIRLNSEAHLRRVSSSVHFVSATRSGSVPGRLCRLTHRAKANLRFSGSEGRCARSLSSRLWKCLSLRLHSICPSHERQRQHGSSLRPSGQEPDSRRHAMDIFRVGLFRDQDDRIFAAIARHLYSLFRRQRNPAYCSSR